ncbi:MAG: InlB B-repeat-containing protein [Rikenellaceae bacterium]
MATYTVSFETNGGSAITAVKVESGLKISQPADPTKDGETFAGWYSDMELTAEFDFNEAITSDITLYASWLVNTLTITFDSCGGSEVEPQTIDYNTTISEPEAPTKNGYSFVDWYSDALLTNLWSFTTKVTTDMTLYAKWSANQYTITFETNGGTEIAPLYAEYGNTITMPDNPTKEGYSFVGWYNDADLSEAWDVNTKIISNITLYAKWSTNQYTVTFESNGGSSVSSQTVAYNEMATEPTEPTKTGCSFAGWYSDSALTTAYNFNIAVIENITLYAKWSTNQYSVSFESNGGSNITTQYVDYGSTATEPTSPTKTGYTFAGWYSDSALTTAYNFNTAVTENITLYAKWSTNQYSVSFESNGGSTVNTQTIYYNTTATEPTAPTRTGYTFEGWYSDSALTQKWSFDTTITANTTIYAKWVSTSGELPDLGTGNAW